MAVLIVKPTIPSSRVANRASGFGPLQKEGRNVPSLPQPLSPVAAVAPEAAPTTAALGISMTNTSALASKTPARLSQSESYPRIAQPSAE